MHKLGVLGLSSLLVSVFACGDPASSLVTADPLGVPGEARAARAVSGRAPVPHAPRADVVLRVTDRVGGPVAGRQVTVVDALGQTSRALTDDEGHVGVGAVATPYDVAVEGSPHGQAPAPWVVLGLSRAEARIATGDATFHAAAPPPARLRLGVLVPGPGSVVEVVSISKGGAGRARVEVTDGSESAKVALSHAFTGDLLAPEDDATVHVLVTSEGGACVRYGRATVARVRAGEPRDVGMIATDGVALEEVTVSATPEHSAGFASGVGVAVDVPGATIASVEGRGHALTARVPLVPGGTLSAWAYAERGEAGALGDLHVGTRAWVTGRPVDGASPLALTLDAPPSPSLPVPGGALSRRSGSLEWAARDLGEARLAAIALAERRTGRVLFRVQTGERAVALSRLVALGVPLPTPGPHVLDVTTTSGSDVADLTAPSPPAVAWGRTTSRRVAFEVTP